MQTPASFAPIGADASGTMARGVEQAGTGAHNTTDEAADAARSVVDRMASGAHQAVDSMANVAGQAAESLNVNGARLRDAQTRLLDRWSRYVRANPFASLGIAIAAGFVLSRVLGSRH